MTSFHVLPQLKPVSRWLATFVVGSSFDIGRDASWSAHSLSMWSLRLAGPKALVTFKSVSEGS